MCDSVVIHAPDGVWLGKNSDREPGEAQAVEWYPAAPAPSSRHARRRCTHVTVADHGPRRAVVLSRPSWMWGAEMGVNASGLAIANEAVFTRMPVPESGLTGMDLLRLALERADTALQGVEVITGLLRRHPQGGRMMHRNRRFRYHSTFLLVDDDDAWVLETAGWLWAARRIPQRVGVYSASNALTIGREHDRVHPEALGHARAQGWCSGSTLDFARAFGDPLMERASGGHARRAHTYQQAAAAAPAPGPTHEVLARTLRSHGGRHPTAGLRMEMPCAHASWWPTREAGQTTGSMIARGGRDPRVWMTGTSSPCLSVFKPVAVDRDAVGPMGAAGERPDQRLWWTHERFHRRVLATHHVERAPGTEERASLQARAWAQTNPERFRVLWDEHRDQIERWTASIRPAQRSWRPFDAFWRRQSRRDGLEP